MNSARRNLISADEIVEAGLADPADLDAMRRVSAEFRARITPAMQQDSAGIRAQFVPDQRELTTRPEELRDPIGDQAHSPVPGLTHRYPDRAILHLTQICDVYCRFCFRREVVGGGGLLPDDQLDAAIAYLARTEAIREVILTGGDPMTIAPRRMAAVLDRLEAIPHLRIMRLHSRVPFVAPQRIARLLPVLRRVSAVVIVIHTNHPDELTADARRAIADLAHAGIQLLSQTVLLRGVNDDATVLAELFRELTELRVTPYYLHHCDLARGTSHFRTTIDEGLRLISALRGHLSGIAIPSYVLDLPGGFGKVPLESRDVTPLGEGRWQIRDWRGGVHRYTDPPR